MLKTEMRNEESMNIDKMDTASIVALINKENMNAVLAVEKAIDDIVAVCDRVAESFEKGGRLFYVGAGTSGRLGVLDASECPPTFGVPKEQVVGVMAGGEKCLSQAGEFEEDNAEEGKNDIKSYSICEKDVVIGISASGGAPYVIGAFEYANSVGAYTVGISNNHDTFIEKISQASIVADTGAEVITGSTRMKAGTAQKIILNMISTCSMVKTGKVYENMMVNLQPSNIKLKDRMVRIVCDIKKCDYNTAMALLDEHGWDIREAVK